MTNVTLTFLISDDIMFETNAKLELSINYLCYNFPCDGAFGVVQLFSLVHFKLLAEFTSSGLFFLLVQIRTSMKLSYHENSYSVK